MINQSVIDTDYKASVVLESAPDADVSIEVLDPDGAIVATGTAEEDPDVEFGYYYNIDKAALNSFGSRVVVWSYEISSIDRKVRNLVDIVFSIATRYCYQSDLKRRLHDMQFPPSFDLGDFTKTAANQMNISLQGLYVLPLAPVSSHVAYDQDVLSLRDLCADIAAGYAIEDLSTTAPSGFAVDFNKKKAIAFAELRRYSEKPYAKVFASIPKNTTKADIAYGTPKPRVSAQKYTDSQGKAEKDPMNQIYNNFDPASDLV